MHALGLNPQDPNHEQYYRAMRVSNPTPVFALSSYTCDLTTPRTKQLLSITDSTKILQTSLTMSALTHQRVLHSSGITFDQIASAGRL